MLKRGIVALLFLLPAVAVAQPHHAYMAFQAGGVWLQNSDNTGGGVDIQSSFKTGYGLAFRVGDQFAEHWRAEWEISYASNDVDKLKIKNDGGLGEYYIGQSLNGTEVSASGRVSALSGMANMLYDFTPEYPYHPYIGAGIGVSRISTHSIGVNGVTVVDDSTAAFAYQGIAGIELDISPQAAVYLDYHYFAAMNPQLRDTLGEKFDTEYKASNFSIGLRYFFR